MANEGERTSGNVGLRLTYVAIARHLGISDDAARMLVRRRGWQRIQPNRKGAPTVVVVPEDELAGEQWRAERTFPYVQGTSPDTEANEDERPANNGEHGLLAGALAALETAVLSLTARAEQAELGREAERQRAEELRSQIDILNAELVVMRAEADRELAEERMRADRFSEQVDAGHHDLDAARENADAISQRLQQAETDLETARAATQEAQDAAEALRRADADRKARGPLRRAWDGWRGR